MDDHARTKEELIEELQALRRRVAELERAPGAPREALEGSEAEARDRRRVEEAEQGEAERARLREEVRALQEVRARLQAILDFSPAVIYAKDTAGRFLLVNRQFEQLFHVNGAELVGKTDHDIFPAAVAEAFRMNDLAALSRGAPLDIEEVAPGHGGLRTYLSSKFPIHDAAGRPYAVCGISTDITERKRDEHALRLLAEVSAALAQSLDFEKTLETVVQLATGYLADFAMLDVLDEAGQLRRLGSSARDPGQNELLQGLTRYPPRVGSGSPLDQVLVGQRPVLIREMPESWLDATARNDEHRRILGALAPRSAMLVPLVVHDRIFGMIHFGSTAPGRLYDERDLAIAEELARRAAFALENARLYEAARQAEAALRDAVRDRDISLSLLDTFIRSAPVGFAVLDRDLRFMKINDTLAAINGPTVVEHLGRRVREVLPALPEAFDHMLQRVIATGEPILGFENETETPGAPGRPRHFLSSYYPIRDGAGEIYALGGVLIEITEQRQLAQQLVRDAELRELLMGVLAHDLRNSLGAITFSASMLLGRTDLTDPALRAVHRVANSARRMEGLISQILDFTRSRSGGGMPIDRKPVNLHDICRLVVEEIEAANPGREVTLVVAGDGSGSWDPDRLGQVVSNLIGNAVTYSPPDAVVWVSIEDGGDRVILSINNQGPPIPPELLPRLFDPFRRGRHASSGHTSKGLGLGLYISDQIVRAHGGSIEVQSNAESGTTVRVALPRSPAG